METAVSTLSTFNTSKEGIKKYVAQVVGEIKNGVMNPLLAKVYIKSLQKSLADIEKGIFETVMIEADKYEKSFEYHGAQISKEELSVKYDFTNCKDVVWDELDRQMKELSAKKKEREALLKTIKESLTMVDEDTSETWKAYPPIKRSTSGIKITIK